MILQKEVLHYNIPAPLHHLSRWDDPWYFMPRQSTSVRYYAVKSKIQNDIFNKSKEPSTDQTYHHFVEIGDDKYPVVCELVIFPSRNKTLKHSFKQHQTKYKTEWGTI